MENINRIFLHKVFKAIADSIIKIFIPLYILKTTNNINLAIVYLIVYSFFVFSLQIATKKLYQRKIILCMILHCIPIIITEAILSFCQINILSVTISAFLMAISQVFYSVPLNILFAIKDKSKNIAKFEIATNTGKIAFIIISGLLLSRVTNSFIFLSGISTIIYISSIIPIGKFYDQKNIPNSSNQPTKYSCNFAFRLYHISFGLFQTTIDSLIPIYLFVNNLSFDAITIIIATVEVFKILANLIAKKLICKKQHKLCCIISFVIFVTSLICILIFKNEILLYVFSSIIAISFPLAFVPLFHIFCRQSKDPATTVTDMTIRDVDIFAPRPLYYGLYFVGGFLAPILLGFASSITMLICQIKTINSHKDIL